MAVYSDIWDSGRQNDGRVYSNSHYGYDIENNTLNTPQPDNVDAVGLKNSYDEAIS